MTRLLLLLIAATFALPAQAALSPNDIAQAGVHPPPGARLPAALAFVDQAGRRETLGALAQGRPVVLLFADYTCRHICGVGLTLTAGAMRDAGLVPGRDLTFLVVGLDPKDGPREASAMAATRLASMTGIAAGTHLLSGDPATVDAVERALGYHAVYDAESDQFAHDTALYVFAPDGKLAALLPEIALRPEALRAAVGNAGTDAPSTGFAARIVTLCHGFATAQGPYGRAIQMALQGGGILMIAGLLAMVRLRRRT